MQTFILPFGKAAWDEKKRIINALIASRKQPPFLYNDVLILVPSARLKRRYARLFLGSLHQVHGVRCLVQPVIQTLHQFIQQQYTALNGPHLIDEQSRLVLLEGLVKERLSGNRLFSQNPDLLAPALSSVLAKTVEQLSLAGISPEALVRQLEAEDFADKPQVTLLRDVYAAYGCVLRDRNFTDPARMRHLLLERFDQARLDRYRTVILDGIHVQEQVEADILKRLAAFTDCMLLVEAPSRTLISAAGEFHPLRIIKDFLDSIEALDIKEQCLPPEGQISLAAALSLTSPSSRPATRFNRQVPFGYDQPAFLDQHARGSLAHRSADQRISPERHSSRLDSRRLSGAR